MRKRLFNQQSGSRSRETQKTWRTSVLARIMMALFALMLIPQAMWAQSGDYPITLNNYNSQGYKVTTSINSNNKGNVLNDGTVSFSYNSTYNTGILTLNGTTFNGYIESQLDALTIEFSGKNIFAATNEYGDIANSGAGHHGYILSTKDGSSLTLKALSSSSSLDIRNEHGNAVAEGFSSITLEDGTYASSGYPFHFDSTNKYYVERRGNKIQTITYTTTPTYMLWIGSSTNGFRQLTDDNLTSTNSGGVITSGTVSFDNSSSTLTLDGATIATGDIESGFGDLKILLKGNNTMTHDGYDGADEPVITSKSGTLTFDTDGTGSLKLQNDGSFGFSYTFSSFSAVNYNNGLVFNPTTNEIAVTIYPLSINALPVTSANQNDILTGANAGKVSYSQDATTGIGTLTLNGASMPGALVWSSNTDLIIQYSGENSITNTTGDAIVTIVTPAPTVRFVSVGTGVDKLTLTSGIVDSPIEGFMVSTNDYDLGEVANASTITRVFTNTLFSGGDGTSGTPFLISTKEDLRDLATFVNTDVLNTTGKYFRVTTDIDCTGLDFNPIGISDDHAFMGTFDGNKKIISNLQVTGVLAGLFGYVLDGNVSNLTLYKCNIKGDNSNEACYAGAIAGKVGGTGSSNICNNKVTGTSTVSVLTPNGYDGYIGAIFGAFNSGVSLKNYYEYTVKVIGNGNVDKTDYTPRGNGFGSEITADDGAVLYTKTLSTPAITHGTITPWYLTNDAYPNSGKFAPGQTAYFMVTPTAGYAITTATVTYTIAGNSQEIDANLEALLSGDGSYVYSFTMPDADDVTATVSLAINISDAVYTATIENATYSPTASLTPTKVKLTSKDGTTITLDSSNNDFTITAQTFGGEPAEFTNAGDYEVTIKGVEAKGYTGTETINYTIDQAQATISAAPTAITGLTYDGSLQNLVNPGTVTGGTMKYSLDYNAADDAWTTTVPQGKNASGNTPYEVYYMVAGNTNYKGVAKSTNNKVEVTISPKTISNTNTDISLNSNSFEYNTQNQKPTITSVVVDGNLSLDSNNDYDETNVGGTDVGLYTVTVNGKGNYTGSASTQFNITATTFSPVITISGWTYGSYSSATNGPTVTNPGGGDVVFKFKKKGDPDTNYSTGVPTQVGDYTVKAEVAAKGNYQAAEATADFTISPLNVTPNVALILPTPSYVYDGTAKTPDVTVTVANAPAALTTNDYDVGYDSNINAGTNTAKVTVTLKGNYTGSKVVNFSISPKDINTAKFSAIDPQTYSGSAFTPKPIVTIVLATGTVTLTEGQDFTYGYSNNVNVPADANTKPTVTITGINNYTSTASTNFTINPAAITPEITVSDWTYGAYNATTNGPKVTDASNPGGGAVTFKYKKQGDPDANYGTSLPTLVGDYTVKAEVAAKGNYQGGTATANFSIKKAAASITPPKAKTLTYNGADQELVSAGSSSDGQVQYKLSTETTWSTSIPKRMDKGTYMVDYQLIGDANHSDIAPASVQVTISPKTISNANTTITLSSSSFVYNTTVQQPSVQSAAVDGKNLTTSDYTVSYNGGTNVGSYTVTVSGTGNYDGSATAGFNITAAPIIPVIEVYEWAYGAYNATTNGPKVTDTSNPGVGAVTFKYKKQGDPDANYGTSLPTLVGDYTVKAEVAAKGNYQGGTATANFSIKKAAASITPPKAKTLTYNGADQELVSAGSSSDGQVQYKLSTETTWSTSIPKRMDKGTYTVDYQLIGDANHSDIAPASVQVTISPKSIGDVTIAAIANQTYTGSVIKPALTLTDGNNVLTEGTHYDVTFTSNVNVGTATATITGKGNYAGSTPRTFTIIPKSIKGVSVTVGDTYTYTSAPIVPADADITVMDGSKILVKNTDFTLSVSNNTNAGTATVTVTGKGNYDSATSETGSFTIDQATITSVTLDQTLFVYAPRVAYSVNVTVMAGSLTVPSGSYTVTVDGVTGNSATAAGTHTVRATARTDIANNFKGYAETTFAIMERTVSIDFGGRTFRTFYDGNETFLLPDGITAYIVTGVNGNAVTVKQVSYVLQGIPVLLESTPGTTNVADPAESFTGNLLKYAATATPATDKHYVLYNNEFVRTTGTINGKVYLDLTGYSGDARSLVIGDGMTGINVSVSDEDDGDAKWYDMQGRRINKPTKSGVYIKDGKKVVVKTRY